MGQETSAKKISVTVAALAVVCVILAASLVGLIVLFNPGNQSNTDQQATINDLEQQITVLQLQLNQTVNPATYLAQIASLQSQLQQYSDQNATINDIITENTNLQRHLQLMNVGSVYPQNTFTQNPDSATTIFSGSTSYTGYVVVQATSTANSTYAQVQYSFGGNILSFNQTIGLSGTAVLPVLPSPDDNSFIVTIGNTQSYISNDTITATANFYY